MTEIPEPCATHVSDWEGDPLSLGAYSYWPRGATETDVSTYASPLAAEDVDDDAEGDEARRKQVATTTSRGADGDGEVGARPEVFFAGEATDMEYQGSVMAAYLSGRRAADELHDATDGGW